MLANGSTVSTEKVARSAMPTTSWPREIWLSRRQLSRFATLALWTALVWLHAHLLWKRIVDLTLFEPLVALRWGATVLIVLAMVRLQQLGLPLFRGRRALVLWLVILLLHAGAIPAVDSHLEALPIDAGWLIAVSLWLVVLGRIVGRRPVVIPLDLLTVLGPRPVSTWPCAPGSLAPLVPRPPPLA